MGRRKDQPLYAGTRDTLGDKFSEGARQLWLLMKKLGWHIADLDREMGWQTGMGYRYLFGDRRPEMETAKAIHAKLGIDVMLFYERPRRPFVPPIVRRAA